MKCQLLEQSTCFYSSEQVYTQIFVCMYQMHVLCTVKQKVQGPGISNLAVRLTKPKVLLSMDMNGRSPAFTIAHR